MLDDWGEFWARTSGLSAWLALLSAALAPAVIAIAATPLISATFPIFITLCPSVIPAQFRAWLLSEWRRYRIMNVP
jgi:hypothetical protein